MHTGSRPGWAPQENLAQESMAEADAAFLCLAAKFISLRLQRDQLLKEVTEQWKEACARLSKSGSSPGWEWKT